MSGSLSLGEGANLLFGYRPAWNPNGSAAAPFFAPPTASTVTYTPSFVAPPANFWDAAPTITLHATPEDLISAVYQYSVAPMALDPGGVNVPAGPLVLDDADRQAAIAAEGAFLGLDLTAAGLSYMLVTFNRVDGTAQHPYVANPSSVDRSTYLTDAAQAAIGNLKPAAATGGNAVLYDWQIAKTDADAYVAALYSLGTHYVSQLTTGDRLIQVFAYDAKNFAILQTAFANDATTQPDGTLAVTGSTAAGYVYYTSQVNGSYGFVSTYGSLVALSRDPALGTAITAGSWASQYVPTGTASIFAAATNYKLLQPLTQSVTTAITLAPIADFIIAALVSSPWDRLVKGALLQKYGDAVDIPMTSEIAYDWDSIFPEASDSWVAPIVTPTIDVYQQRVDLANVQLQGTSIVAANSRMQSFTSFSQVLEATTPAGAAPIALPSDNITLVAQIIDMSGATQTPVISMSANAFTQFSVFCQEMYGTLIFEAPGSGGTTMRKVALDGFLFETQSAPDATTGRYTVDLSGVLSDAPSATVISNLKQSIEFSIVAGESLLQSSGTNAAVVQELEVSYLQWLAGIIPADTQDADLANNRARALYLANHVGTFSADVVYVPYVTYETYTKYVNDLVTQASTINGQILNYQTQITDTINSFQVMNSIAAVNANIKQIGGVLTQYFQALADGRAAMDGYYSSLEQQFSDELQQTLKDISDLTTKLQAQQTVISQTADPPGIIQQFQQDYADYENDQIAQAVMTGVAGLFDVGLSVFAIPEEAAGGVLKGLTAFKAVYDKLQAVMQVLQSLQALISGAGTDIDNLNTLSNQIASLGPTGNLQMPSQVDLLSVAQNVQAALANVPNSGALNQDKANLIAAVNTLVTIGSALIEAQTKASQIAMESANTNRLQQINSGQQAKMEALTTALHLQDSNPPDLSSLDLIGITGQLQYQLKQVLLSLAQTLELQNGALQYEYFGQPTAITSFTLQNLVTVISTQDSNIINGLSQLNPEPQAVTQPITFTITGVQASRLSGTNVYQFPIHLATTEFYDYDMVRIDRVVPNITNIRSTASGNYEIHLACDAKPFQDRDYSRNALTFASIQRSFGPYVYAISSGAAQFGDQTGTFADQVTHLTPFSLWEISLPNSVQNNQNIQFSSLLVDISLDFYITAHYDDPVARAQTLLSRRRAKTPQLFAAVATTADDSTTPSLANLEAQMYQNQEVLQGWDAVFNILEDPVNAFLNQQFQAYLAQLNPNSQTGLMGISAYYCEGPVPISHTAYISNVTQLNFELSNPLLQFVAGNDSVTVNQYIMSGSVANGTLAVASTFNPSACQLTSANVTFTFNGSTLTLSAPVLANDMNVLVSSTGTLPSPLLANTDYWTVNWTSSGGITTVQLSNTAGGAPIALSGGSGTFTIAPDIFWAPPLTVDTSQNPYVQGSVALAKVAGIVQPPSGQGSSSDTLTVILDFPSGAFVLNQFSVNPPNWDPNHHATAISNALANFFANSDIKYQIHTINMTNLSSDAALTPSAFMLNAASTNAGNNILQVLIATTGTVQNAHTITLNEPVPYDPANPVPGVSDFTVTLMVSSQLMFQHIFVNSFNPGSTNVLVAAVDPGQNFKAWGAQVTAGTATGPVPFNNPHDVDGTSTNYRISDSSNNLTWSLVNMQFQASADAGVALAYSNGTANTSPPTGGTDVSFQYQQWIPAQALPHGGVIPGHWSNWETADATAYLTMSGNYPLQVTGSGASQVVTFTDTLPTITFSQGSDLKPSSGCDCNDNDVKIALLQSLGNSVPSTLQTYIQQIRFQPISVFTLESLLFPADQLITMREALVPGDLLVAGSFLAKVRQTNATYNVLISAASGAKGVFGSTNFQNGQGTGSATQNGLPNSFQFQYGPINSALGGLATYTIDINAGTVSPVLMVVVDQPDPVNHPETIILLPPGYPPTTS